MTTGLLQCPNPECGCPVQPTDHFCPFCGRALTPAGKETPASDARSVTPQIEAALGKIELGVRAIAQPEGPRFGLQAARVSTTDCPDLEVLYNNSCVFVLNMQSTFDFELHPQVDGLRDLFIEVRQSGQVIARETPVVIPKRGVPLPLSLNYTPRHTHAGKASFTIVIGYRKEGQARLFAASRTHTIYSGKEDVRQVCESLVVEIKNNIQQGHAGDLRVDQNFNDLREALHHRTSIELDREFLQLINARPFWAPLPLAECAPEAFVNAPFGQALGPCSRVQLQSADGLRLWLLTDPVIRVGRHRSCDIIARILDTGGRELREASLRISQFHAQIAWQGGQCVLRDGGRYPDKEGWRPSGAGVWVNAERLPPGSEWRFVPGREYRITLGEDGPNAYALSARLYVAAELLDFAPRCLATGAPPETPACLVLRRLQGPSWIYLVLHLGASLGWADARCGRACVCVRSGGLQFGEGHTCDWLTPGQMIQAGALAFRVVEFDHATHALPKNR